MINLSNPFVADCHSFLRNALATGGFSTVPPGISLSAPRKSAPRKSAPHERVNVACIGISNRAAEAVAVLDGICLSKPVAFCDVDPSVEQTLMTPEMSPWLAVARKSESRGTSSESIGRMSPLRPKGPIKVRLEKQPDGSMKSAIEFLKGIERVK